MYALLTAPFSIPSTCVIGLREEYYIDLPIVLKGTFLRGLKRGMYIYKKGLGMFSGVFLKEYSIW